MSQELGRHLKSRGGDKTAKAATKPRLHVLPEQGQGRGARQAGIRRKLVGGLSARRMEQILVQAICSKGVENRTLAFYLHDMDQRLEHQQLGFPTTVKFAEVRLEMSRRKARELIATGRALLELSAIDEAYAQGQLSWSRARLLARVATPETEATWLELALKLTSKELEREVAGLKQGALPRKDKLGLPGVRFKLVMKVSGLVHELWQQVREKLQMEAGEELGDEALLHAVSDCVLRQSARPGGGAAGRLEDSLFRVVVAHDPATGSSSLRTLEGSRPIEKSTAAMLMCDAELVDAKGEGARPTPHPELPGGIDQPTSRALRRRILARDGGRCKSCGSRVGLMVHHIRFRSEGGRTAPDNLGTLCMSCHALVHEGLLKLQGRAPDSLRFLDREGRDVCRSDVGGAKGALVIERTPEEKASRGARAPDARPLVTIENLPEVVDAAWWRRHRHLFTWNSQRRALEFSPGRPRVASPALAVQGAETLREADRPARLSEVIGQKQVVEGLQLAVQAAKRAGRPLWHVLFEGPPGLGKTSLARALACEMGSHLHLACGAALANPAELLALMTSLEPGDLLFVDEIHALSRKLGELIYQSLEDGTLSLGVVSGMVARTLTIKLVPFTLVGATTDPERIPKPLRDRFCRKKELEFYEVSELEQIITRATKRRQLVLDPAATTLLAQASQGTPRLALALVTELSDLALARARHHLDEGAAREALKLAGLDGRGLGSRQRAALAHLNNRRRPVGTRTLAALLGVTVRTFKVAAGGASSKSRAP